MKFEDAYAKVQPILIKGSKDVADFGWIGSNHHKAYVNAVCHAAIGRDGAVDPRTEFYYTTVTPNRDPKRLQAIYDYCCWILSDDGPYKNITKDRDRTIVVHEGGVAGILLRVEMTDDVALIRNMSMALRLTGEHKQHFESYERFRSLGLSEVDSFYLANYYVPGATDKAVGKLPPNSNHMICPNPMDFDLKRFADGNPYFWDKSLDGTKKGKHHDPNAGDLGYAITTGCFRTGKLARGDAIYESPKLKDTGYITGRWHKTLAGINYNEVATYWNDEYKPEFMKRFAA